MIPIGRSCPDDDGPGDATPGDDPDELEVTRSTNPTTPSAAAMTATRHSHGDG